MPEVQDAGVAPHEVQAHGEDPEDQGLAQQLGVVLARDQGQAERDQGTGRKHGETPGGSHPPKSPRGRNRMITMAISSTAACAVVAEIR